VEILGILTVEEEQKRRGEPLTPMPTPPGTIAWDTNTTSISISKMYAKYMDKVTKGFQNEEVPNIIQPTPIIDQNLQDNQAPNVKWEEEK